MLAHFAKPEVVVMGVSMPVLDGIEAARLLKASPSTRHVRVIAYTAWPSFYDGPLKSVFDGVLAKPSTSESLIASVRQFLAPDDSGVQRPRSPLSLTRDGAIIRRHGFPCRLEHRS